MAGRGVGLTGKVLKARICLDDLDGKERSHMSWNLSDAKNRLSEVLSRAASDGPQTIRRRKQDFVVLPRQRYEQLVGQRASFKDWLLKGPRLDDLVLPSRDRSAMREAGL